MATTVYILTRTIFDGRRMERHDVVCLKRSLEDVKVAAQRDFDEGFMYTCGGIPHTLKWTGNTESDRDVVCWTCVSTLCDPVYWTVEKSELKD